LRNEIERLIQIFEAIRQRAVLRYRICKNEEHCIEKPQELKRTISEPALFSRLHLQNQTAGENRHFSDINIVKRKSIRKSAPTVSANLADERCSSGVEGLDDILAGGLPRRGFYLIQGDPGSGKTTLALQFLLEGLRQGEKVFYITLSETKQELLQVARSHGWSLDKIPVLDLSAVENLLRPEAQTTVFHPSEVELTKISQLLLDEVRKTQPARFRFAFRIPINGRNRFTLPAPTSGAQTAVRNIQ
jgi:hypothetical protein